MLTGFTEVLIFGKSDTVFEFCSIDAKSLFWAVRDPTLNIRGFRENGDNGGFAEEILPAEIGETYRTSLIIPVFCFCVVEKYSRDTDLSAVVKSYSSLFVLIIS